MAETTCPLGVHHLCAIETDPVSFVAIAAETGCQEVSLFARQPSSSSSFPLLNHENNTTTVPRILPIRSFLTRLGMSQCRVLLQALASVPTVPLVVQANKALLTLAVLLFTADFSAHVAAESEVNTVRDCNSASTLGRFEPHTDILLANFDNKPDTDDMLAVAGLATMLRDDRFSCVRYVATTGAYGTTMESFVEEAAQWRFIKADSLFDLAFPGNWIDAHKNRVAAIALLADRALITLQGGGDVWIMEGGQSDLSAAVVQRVSEADPWIDLRSRIHLVQHSAVNEYLTTPSALAYVRDHLDYIIRPDGNIVANGSPGFETLDATAWPALLADACCGAVWEEARRLALQNNTTSGHPNDVIAKGGLDFSDLAEATYIFGFEQLVDVDAFVTEFVLH